MHINPDHFLETPEGRLWTTERNAQAWALCHAAFDTALASAAPGCRVYLLVGAQGSGKSTWARKRAQQEPDALIVDAILVTRAERASLLGKAAARHARVVAVWFQTPLSECLARNAARPADQICAEQGIRNVFAALEPPTAAEGFASVIMVPADHALAASVPHDLHRHDIPP